MGQFKLLLVVMACGICMTSSQSTRRTESNVDSSSDLMTATSSTARDNIPDASSLPTPGTENGTSMMPEDISPTENGDMSTMTTSRRPVESTLTNEPENGPTPPVPGGPDDVNGDRQPLEAPVWNRCLNDVTSEDQSGTDIVGVFKTWCRNYDAIIECLSRDLPANAFTNPFDFFIYLNFDPVEMHNKSRDVCDQLEAVDSKLSCAITQNESVAATCSNGFSGGLFHIFDIFNHRDVPEGILEEIACDVTTQTTFCLRQALPDCDDDVVLPVLNYYALFTNDTCIAKPGGELPSQNLPPKQPQTVVVKCANEAAQTLTPDQSVAQPASLVDFVILGLKADCKTYKVRYECYERELRNITNFLDFWLSLTFDYNNALASQQLYCTQIEESIIPRLTDECFNQSQPGLAQCEAGFGKELETIRQDLLENGDFDRIQLQTIACRTSVTRAVCLGNAMRHCGDDVAKAMSVSEMGILPDDCRHLLARLNSPAAGDQSPETATETETHEEGNYQSDDALSYGVQTEPNRSHSGNDREGVRESKTASGKESESPNKSKAGFGQTDNAVNENDMDLSGSTQETNKDNKTDKSNQKKNEENGTSSSKTQSGTDEGGASDVRANLVTMSLVVSLIFFFLKP